MLLHSEEKLKQRQYRLQLRLQKKAMTISEELEALLFADRSTVKENDLRMTLQKAGGLYQQIRLKELEIDSLFKTFCKKSAASSKEAEGN